MYVVRLKIFPIKWSQFYNEQHKTTPGFVVLWSNEMHCHKGCVKEDFQRHRFHITIQSHSVSLESESVFLAMGSPVVTCIPSSYNSYQMGNVKIWLKKWGHPTASFWKWNLSVLYRTVYYAQRKTPSLLFCIQQLTDAHDWLVSQRLSRESESSFVPTRGQFDLLSTWPQLLGVEFTSSRK